MSTASDTGRWAPPSWLTAAMIAFGALLRWAALEHQEAISVDSVRYLEFAQGWLQRQFFTLGPTGLREFPDLGYPLFVSFFIPSVGDPIRAAQLVSWFAGVGVMVLVYRVAKATYGSHAAFFATFLAAVSQPLIVASGQPLTESLFLFFSMMALNATLDCLRKPSAGVGMLLGFACGFGYLTRGIGILLLPLAVGVLWRYARRGDGGPVLKQEAVEDPLRQSAELERYQASLVGSAWASCLVGIAMLWLAIVVPYWVMLNATYGGFTLSDQAIWHVGNVTGGLTPHSPDIRLEGTLNETGTDYALNDWFEAGRPKSGGIALGGLIERYAKNLVAIAYYIPEELFDPLTLILLTLGIFGGGVKPRLRNASALLLWWMVPYLLLQPLFLTLARYLLPCVPILLIFAGRGIVHLQAWAIGRHLLRRPKADIGDLMFAERVVFVVLFLLYAPAMIWPITHVDPRYQNLETKAAGQWLKRNDAQGGVFATTAVAGYYAGLTPNLVLPDAELPAILKMADIKAIRYLVLDERRVPDTRPDALAALLYVEPEDLPSSLYWLHDVDTYPGYRVRILEIRRSGLAALPDMP